MEKSAIDTNTKTPSSSSRYAWEGDLGLGDEGLASHTFGTKRLAHADEAKLHFTGTERNSIINHWRKNQI